MTMDRETIQAEVRRLAPWYYLFDLSGVRTDSVAAVDHWGHRQVGLPAEVVPFVQRRRVLDVGCNEGGYAFAALQSGATLVHGIDCRPTNIEKARLVARVLGATATFEVGSADTWHATEPFDVVFLCGLLYHLPTPWLTVERYCQVAAEGIFVTTMLHQGKGDGYTAWRESDSQAASEHPSVASMPPRSVNTLVTEFARHGFDLACSVEFRLVAPTRRRLLGTRGSRLVAQRKVAMLTGIERLRSMLGQRSQRTWIVGPEESAPFAGSASLYFRRRGLGA